MHTARMKSPKLTYKYGIGSTHGGFSLKIGVSRISAVLLNYIVRRLLMMLVTLFLGISLLTFIIINLAPGSPVEQKLQAMRMGADRKADATVSDEVIEALKKQYGFDKPIHVRYAIWLKNMAHFGFWRELQLSGARDRRDRR